jgi:tyrosine phenol-lyase
MIIKTSDGREIPVEMYKIKIIQNVNLIPAEERLKAIENAGYNTFLVRSKDIFIDMLTDSGTNAMSDNQLGAAMLYDDAYAGSESFYKLAHAVGKVLGFKYVLPTHQGRASEHLIAKVFVKEGNIVLTNYHFTTTKAHIELVGGKVLEIFGDEALNTQSKYLFKGNMDIQKLKDAIKKYGRDKIAFVRMEATTNLIGGQPFSVENLKQVKKVCSDNGIILVMDGSLVSENAYLIQQREKGYENKSVAEIVKEVVSLADLFYMSARKNSSVKGSIIATNQSDLYEKIKPWLPVYEGFLTYGGMSTKEIEAMAVGLEEMVDQHVASSTIEQVKYFVESLRAQGIPVITPPGGLACHLDAKRFIPHIPQDQYPAGALTGALYIASGVRSMERGTISMDRDKDGKEQFADLEITRLAVPRRVYTVSHIEYVIDRILWLYKHRDLIKGLTFVDEPPILRFFFGKLKAIDNWGKKLCDAFKKDFGAKM